VDTLYAKLESAKSNEASVAGEFRPTNAVTREPTMSDVATANFVKQKTTSTRICFNHSKPGGCKRVDCRFQHPAETKPKEAEVKAPVQDKKEGTPSHEKKPCSKCGELGHWWRKCSYKGKCGWCGKAHKEDICPRKKNGEPKVLAAVSEDGQHVQANMVRAFLDPGAYTQAAGSATASSASKNPTSASQKNSSASQKPASASAEACSCLEGNSNPKPRPEVATNAAVCGVRLENPTTSVMLAKAEKITKVPEGMELERFIADTGANRTIYPNARSAFEYSRLPVDIKTASGAGIKSDGIGKLKTYTPDLQEVCLFDNVLFCKDVTEKLASIGELCQSGGLVCVFDEHKLTTYRKDDLKIQGKQFTCDLRDAKSGLYPLTLLRKKGETAATATVMAAIVDEPKDYGGFDLPDTIQAKEKLPAALLAKVYVKPGLSEAERYHAKFGDIGAKYLKRIMPTLKIPTQFRCEACIDGKMHKFNHKACAAGVRPVHAPGTCIHTDHSGPYTKSLNNARYSQLYLDRGSGYLWAVRQTKKTDHYESTPKIFVDSWGLSGNRVQVLRSDGDGVFTSVENRKMLEAAQVRQECSAPYDSDTNPFIERARRTVFEGVATALIRSGAPARFWGEAENHKIFTINCLPTVEDPEKPGAYCSRKNLLQGNRVPANLEILMAFGTSVTCYIPVERRVGGKTPSQRKSFHGVLMGYEANSPSYRVWDIEARKIRVVSFNFTICHEGFYPFLEKMNWPPECVADPVCFSPDFGVETKTEWDKYDYDDEESMEARNQKALFYQPRTGSHNVEPESRATGCVTPSKDPRITDPAWSQMEGQCLTDTHQNQLQDTIHPNFKGGVKIVKDVSPHDAHKGSTTEQREEKNEKKKSVDESRAGLPDFSNFPKKHASLSPQSEERHVDRVEPILDENPPDLHGLRGKPSKTHTFWDGILKKYYHGNFCEVPPGIFPSGFPKFGETLGDKPVGIPPPKTLREARLCPWWPEYKKAAQTEFDGHLKSQTWTLVPRSSVPPGKNILRGKWVFDDKRDEAGKIIKFKSRFVAMGFTQKYGIDYQETFAGVMIGKSFRIMLVILNEDPTHEIEHWDVRQAFTQAKLDEDLYMHQPELFEDRPDEFVCKLLKSIYGLKQAAKNWRDMLKRMFLKAKFIPLLSDPCVFILKVGNAWCVCSTHVDDIFTLYNKEGKKYRDTLFLTISSEVEVENLGPVTWALKTNILRDRTAGVLKISQEAYVNELLQKYEVTGESTNPTNDKLFLPEAGCDTTVNPSLKTKFQGQIGALWWLATISRPDIFYAVHRCSKMQQQPNGVLESCLKKILEYLASTRSVGIIYERREEKTPLLSGYVDAAFGTEDEAQSRVGYFFLFRGNLVSWTSENPTRVMTSSTEAECRGLVQFSKENLWHRQLHNELGIYKLTGPTIVYEDNQSAISMANNPGTPHKRAKHFGIEFAFFKQSVDLKEVKPEYVSTEEQAADMLTKTLTVAKFTKLRDMVMGMKTKQVHFSTQQLTKI